MQRLEELTRSIRALEQEVNRLRHEFRRRTLAVVFIVALTGTMVVLVSRVEEENSNAIAQNNKIFCPLLKVLTDASFPPPTTARGFSFAQRASELSLKFDCPQADR